MPNEFDLVIHNATVVTVNEADDVVDRGMICVRGGRIERVAPLPEGALPPAAADTVDAGGAIAMPGLVNTHTHLPMTLFRGLADDLPLDAWLTDHIFPAESAHMTPDTARRAARVGCAELLLSGTTACCDGYFHEDEVAAAVLESGLRAVAGQGVVDFPAPGVPDPRRNVTAAIDFLERWQGVSERLRPAIFCHAPYTCGPETLKRAKAAARRSGALFQIHVAETERERSECIRAHGVSPVGYLDRLGLLDKDTLLVHTIWVDGGDIETIAARGAAVSVTTESEMKLASGVAPLPDFLQAGIAAGLGTDGSASNNDLDMFGELDFTAKLHKVVRRDPQIMDAATVLRAATAGAARAVGLGESVGSLEPGKQADIVLVDTRAPHLVPLYNPVSQLVYAAGGSDVRDVWVGGRPVVRDRRLLTLGVEAAVAALTETAGALAANIRQAGKRHPPTPVGEQ